MNAEIGPWKINWLEFKVKVSDKSAVAEIAEKTNLPVAHLLLVCEPEDTTWEKLTLAAVTRGQLLDLVDTKMPTIIGEFLPGLAPEDAAYRIEMNSALAASRPTVHCHILLAHKELFGKNGLFRRCIDSAMKQG